MQNISDMTIYCHEIKVKILNLNVSTKFRFSNKTSQTRNLPKLHVFYERQLLKIGFIHNFYDKAQMGYMENVSS